MSNTINRLTRAFDVQPRSTLDSAQTQRTGGAASFFNTRMAGSGCGTAASSAQGGGLAGAMQDLATLAQQNPQLLEQALTSAITQALEQVLGLGDSSAGLGDSSSTGLGGTGSTSLGDSSSTGLGGTGSTGLGDSSATGSGGFNAPSSTGSGASSSTGLGDSSAGAAGAIGGASGYGTRDINAAAFAAPATYNAQTHAYIAANTPNYAQVAQKVGGDLDKLTGPNSSLTPDQRQEMIDSTIDCAQRFGPKSLPLEQRSALILADIGAESSWRVGTSASNGQYGKSVGVQQVTPSIIATGYAKAGGTQNFDANSIWGNMHLANWQIATMGAQGGQFENTAGTKPSSWYTGLYYYSGQPQVAEGEKTLPDTKYRQNQTEFLAKMGYSGEIFDAGW